MRLSEPQLFNLRKWKRRTHHLSEIPFGVFEGRTAFTTVAPPRFETVALDAHKVIPEFRARVSYPAEDVKEFAYHQFPFFSSRWCIKIETR